jgi:hypothetical protein
MLTMVVGYRITDKGRRSRTWQVPIKRGAHESCYRCKNANRHPQTSFWVEEDSENGPLPDVVIGAET